jgi:hypothetical protein
VGLEVLAAVVVLPASCLAYSTTLKMEATCTSETSVDFERITRRCIPEDRIVLISSLRSQDCAVGIATGCEVNGPQQGYEIILVSLASEPALGPSQPPIQWPLGLSQRW